MFKDKQLKKLFEGQWWYMPDAKYKPAPADLWFLISHFSFLIPHSILFLWLRRGYSCSAKHKKN